MKRSPFFTSFLLLVSIITGGCVGQKNQLGSQAEATTPSFGIHVAVTPENLQFLDFYFTALGLSDPRLRKAIPQDQAVKSALEFEPLGKNATSINTQIGYFEKISVIDLQHQRLVWLITYHGIDTVSSGPPGAERHKAHTLTVAVDAFQGVGIASMTLAVVTPEPGASQTAVPSLTQLRMPSLQTPPFVPATVTARFASPSPQPAATHNDVLSDPATVIKNYAELLTAFNQKLKTTGWIRTVSTMVYFDNIKKAYQDPRVMETWIRLDQEGQLIEGYTWLSASDGATEQETLYQGGIWYNVTLGGSSRSYNTKVDFTGGLLDDLKNGEKITQEAVRYHDANAWRFFFEINDGGLRMARAMFINRDSGLIAGNETYAVQPDESLQLVSGVIYTRFEINANPPLERFQQILDKAQKMHESFPRDISKGIFSVGTLLFQNFRFLKRTTPRCV